MNLSGYPQASVNSPYSKIGMGNLVTRKSTYFFSMGGVAYAVSSPLHVNPFNPAANAAFDTLSFTFSGGLVSKFATLSTNDNSSPSNFATLGYLLFGFPINRNLKTSIGLTPYSNVGYRIISEEIVPDVGRTEYYFEGSGGSNEFFLSNAYQVHKNLSLGLKVSYMFGKSQRSSMVLFPDSAGYINSRVDNQIDLGDLYFEFGMQYQKLLKNGLTLGFGGVFAPSQNISSTGNYIARSFFSTGLGVESYRDSIDSRIDIKGSVTIPEKYGVGVMLRNDSKWLVAADFDWQHWKNFQAFGVADSLDNSMRFALGGEYLQSNRSIDTYWKKIRYRAGFRYQKTYVNFQETQINEIGITFGLGLPIPRSFSNVNLGFEIGRSGTTESNLIRENFFKINIGLSIWERWFIKRKYY
jgi:hypothetical protein